MERREHARGGVGGRSRFRREKVSLANRRRKEWKERACSAALHAPFPDGSAYLEDGRAQARAGLQPRPRVPATFRNAPLS